MPKIKKPRKHSTRPLHKRIALHPVNILLFLCAGVLITMSTLPSAADSLLVTAKVAAPFVTSPATITSYYDQEHTTVSSIVVSGNCSSQTAYVNLLQNNVIVGTSDCSNGYYTVHATLIPGANQLRADAFNSTNDEGPSLPTITVFYDNVSPTPPPTSNPTPALPSLSIGTIDGAPYSYRKILFASTRPTFRGQALPYSRIIIKFHSSTVTCITQADKNGHWSCTISQTLSPGIYSLDITVVAPNGKSISLPTIQITVESSVPSLLQSIPTDVNALIMIYSYQYQIRHPGEMWHWNIEASGGALAYSLAAEWGDNETTQTQNVGASFTLTHTFDQVGTYHIIVHLSDSSGKTASLQLLAIVRAYPTPLTSTTPSIIGDIRSYLWIIWPAYIIIFLMLVSFWLGESEAFKLALKAKPHHRRHPHRRS